VISTIRSGVARKLPKEVMNEHIALRRAGAGEVVFDGCMTWQLYQQV
jgi:hypothetical protein